MDSHEKLADAQLGEPLSQYVFGDLVSRAGGTATVSIFGSSIPNIPVLHHVAASPGDAVLMVRGGVVPLTVVGSYSSLAKPTTRVATTVATSPTTATTESGEVQVISVTAPVVAGQVYRVAFDGHFHADAAPTNMLFRIREDSAAGTLIQTGHFQIFAVSGAGVKAPIISVEYTADVSEDKTFVGLRDRNSGSAATRLFAAADQPSYFYVDYIRG